MIVCDKNYPSFPLAPILSMLAGLACILILRFFSTAHSGIDIGIQIQAAQNLLAGNGLKTWAIGNHFLIDRPSIILTHFPCGFSWLIAFFLKLQIPLPISLKIYGILFTTLGWLGWVVLITRHLKFQNTCHLVWAILLCLCFFSMPIFTTPGWYGTDIVPWAMVPWLIFCLLNSVQLSGQRALAYCLLAGFIAGIAFIFRYAGVAFFMFGASIIFLGSLSSLRQIFSKMFFYGLGYCPFLAIQFYYLYILGPEGASVGGIRPSLNVHSLSQKGFEAMQQLPAINNSLLFWLPDRLKNLCVGGWSNLTGEWPIFSYSITLFLIFLPLLVAHFIGFNKKGTIFQDPRFVMSWFIPTMGLFLFACTVQGTWSYAGDRRYYLPLVPLTCFLLVFLALQTDDYPKKLYSRLLQFLFKSFCFSLSVSMSLFLVFLFLPGAYGNVARGKAEFSLADFPNLGFKYEKFKSRELALNWIHRNPNGHVLTNFIDFFLVDDSIDQQKIHRIPASEALKGMKIRGPMRILVVGMYNGDGMPRTVDAYGNVIAVPELLKLPNQTKPIVFDEISFPAEKIQVFEAFIDDKLELNF
jgi:hypothetical protein